MANPASIRDDLTAAMKLGDRDRVRTLRSLLSALDNAGSVPDDGRDPSIGVYAGEGTRNEMAPEDFRRIVQTEIGERTEAVTVYRTAGRIDIAQQIEVEIGILSGYLD
jgi:uncharacterized protein YqeY